MYHFLILLMLSESNGSLDNYLLKVFTIAFCVGRLNHAVCFAFFTHNPFLRISGMLLTYTGICFGRESLDLCDLDFLDYVSFSGFFRSMDYTTLGFVSFCFRPFVPSFKNKNPQIDSREIAPTNPTKMY